MNKLFNRKTMKLYVVLLIVSFVAGCVCAGFTVKYKNDFKDATASSSTEVIANALTSIISSVSGKDLPSATQDKEYDDATKAIIAKKNASLAVMIVFYVLTVVFISGAVTASEYPKYLESDKYRAKLRRIEKAAKVQKKEAEAEK